MSASIWCANCESSIEHTGQEHKPRTRVATPIIPILPHERVRSVSLARPRRHDSQNHDCDEPDRYAEEGAEVEDLWQNGMTEHDSSASHPCHEEVGNENVPSFRDVLWMLNGPTGDDGVGTEEGDGGSSKDPG